MSTVDLHSLSDGERDVLRLLAEGHTVKSIAALTGRSAHSVNERLRDARRKTGSGSSRELARLLREQENRDENIGVATALSIARPAESAPPGARWQGKVLLMILLTTGAAALALMMSSGSQTMNDRDDPAFAAVAGQWGLSPASVRATMAAEPRDPNWAAPTEATLRARYVAVRGVDPNTLRVTCRTSWCEVLGRSAADVPAKTLKEAAATLGSARFRQGPGRDNLHAEVTGTNSSDTGGPYHFSLLAYWHRQSG